MTDEPADEPKKEYRDDVRKRKESEWEERYGTLEKRIANMEALKEGGGITPPMTDAKCIIDAIKGRFS